MNKSVLIFGFCFFAFISGYAQKVGLVLSGGGAPGIAHIGIIKALEENNIPIDYITGTSMGAIVGGMYAMGMSASEMVTVIKSDDFKRWTSGESEQNNSYFYYTSSPTSGIISLRFANDKKSGIDFKNIALPTNLVPPHEANLAFVPLFAQANALCKSNFDSLFVPFRCVASDIYKKEAVVFRQGDLGDAIRASATFPFLYKPIEIEGRLLFDGGIYNNFPADIMLSDFHPDYIIGSVVAYNPPKPDRKDVMMQLQNMIIRPTDYSLPPSAGLLLNFDLKTVTTFDFSKVDELVKIGYDSTIVHLDEIKQRVVRTVPKNKIIRKREMYKSSFAPLLFQKVNIEGIDSILRQNVTQLFDSKSETFDINKCRQNYFKIISNDNIAEVIPHATFNAITGKFDLNLKVETKNVNKISVGGNLSSTSANEGYIGISSTTNAQTSFLDGQFGKIYNGLRLGIQVELPTKKNCNLKLAFVAHQFEYQNGSCNPLNNYTQHELYSKLSIGFPLSMSGIMECGVGYGVLSDYIASDRSRYSLGAAFARLENNTLNNFMYPTKGHSYSATLQLLGGSESYHPADNTATDFTGKKVVWVQCKAKSDQYFPLSPNFSLGTYFEFIYSSKPSSIYYSGAVSQAQAFAPTPYLRAVHNDAFRANRFGAIGLKPIYNVSKQVHLRNESYWFVPYQSVQRGADHLALYTAPFSTSQFTTETAIVFAHKAFSASLFLNYCSLGNSKWNLGFNVGVLLFTPKFKD